jgi:hypothetical protein
MFILRIYLFYGDRQISKVGEDNNLVRRCGLVDVNQSHSNTVAGSNPAPHNIKN